MLKTTVQDLLARIQPESGAVPDRDAGSPFFLYGTHHINWVFAGVQCGLKTAFATLSFSSGTRQTNRAKVESTV
jgi:hypothetical protein